ncbi:hypothetical protein J5N97_019374 [Dioscorea zingiberensis]|uniref:Uncharacterized protein n=1 Tax=Dioscorea zingiberensis TaxID=325984 RepID=A0A9D5HCM0_9LILI|nr:hypothetical protein J5N97_019374 [Dioscorea zingiberensis]
MDSCKSSKCSSNSRNSTNSNPSDHQRRNLQESNENDEPNPKRPLEKHSKTGIVSLGNKKKILAERNDGFSPDCDENIFRREASAVHLCSDSRSPAPYDPVINYTSPRPLFLRYNPNRGREILRRIEGELKNEKVSSELLPASSEECVEDDEEDDDEEEEEEEEVFEEKPQFIEEIFLDSSNVDVFREGVDIKRVEDEILKVGIGEEINSAEKEEQETLPLVENEISSEKEKIVSIEVMEKKDGLNEFGQDSHNQLVSLMPLADGNPEERQPPAIFSNSEKVLNDANLLLLLLTTFSAVLVGILVHLCRRPKSGPAAVPIEIEAKITDPNATLQIEKDNVSAVKLEHKHKEFHGSRPPIVELLGEFSLDNLDSKKGENLQMVQYQRKKVMKKPSTSVNMIYQSSSMKSSAAVESTTTPEKPLWKEDEEINKGVSTTPLRRSNRIRNRNASPLNS